MDQTTAHSGTLLSHRLSNETDWNALGRSPEASSDGRYNPLGKLMRVIAKAIADRESEIERLIKRLQAEIW